MGTSNGNGDLTAKQRVVLDMLKRGKTVEQIAAQQQVKTNIVHSHLSRLRAKGYVDEAGNLTEAEPSQAPVVDLSGDASGSAVSGESPFVLDTEVGIHLDAQREGLSGTLGQIRNAVKSHVVRLEEIDKEGAAHKEAIERLESQASQAEAALASLGGAVPEAV